MQQLTRIRPIIFLLMTSGVTSCANNPDLNYYLHHPAALKEAVAQCQQDPRQNRCSQIDQYNTEITEALVSAQTNPQEFGGTILKLQQDIASLQQQLAMLQQQKNPQQIMALRLQLQQAQHKNRIYMAIVRWLEDPNA